MESGIILKGIGSFYYVKVVDTIYECKARGVFRKGDITPLPGDIVSITVLDEEKKLGSIEKIHPRSSCLVRPPVANVDQVVLVAAVKSPAPDLMLLDKLIITADLKNLDILICFNKIDMGEEKEYRALASCYQKAGYPVVLVSGVQDKGIEELRQHLKGKVSVFSGQSGVGKSTLLNRLKSAQVMKTGEVSRKIERGRHTTRHVEVFEIPEGGYVVDTPGFSSFEVSDLSSGELDRYYREFEEYRQSCRFRGCSHISEPDCTVKAALEEGHIDKGRYSRYAEIYNLLKKKKEW